MEKNLAQVRKNVFIWPCGHYKIVERHWQYIKYTAFKGRINRPITDLVHALIGDSVTGSWMGGTVLEWFKQKQEITDSGRFLPRANCKMRQIE